MFPLRVHPALTAGQAAVAGDEILVTALPLDPSTASCARDAVRAALDRPGTDIERVRDVMLMVSELATNAYQHAALFGPHELWVSVSGDEAVCAVFDARPMADFSGDISFSGDCGRGLAIVADLSGGHWGIDPAQSRLRPDVAGKAVWFTCPLL